jgi:anti-sigma factor RsiW
MHVTEGHLRTYLDHELSDREASAVKDHLATCGECLDRLREIQSRSSRIAQHLEPPALRREPADGVVLLQRARAQLTGEQHPAKYRFPGRLRPVAAFALLALLVLLSFSYQPVRAWAASFLNLFRMQQISVVRVDPANLRQLGQRIQHSQASPMIEKLFADDLHLIRRGTGRRVDTVEEAGRTAGFGVRTPSAVKTAAAYSVQPRVDISMVIDAARLEDVLDEIGRSDIRLPEGIDGQTITADIPPSVTAFFGRCPPLDENGECSGEDHERYYPGCKVLVQLPTPVVAAPPSLDASRLGQALLQLFGLTEDQARQFSSDVDWTTTFVVPLPLGSEKSFAEVDVDGVRGVWMGRERHGVAWYQLTWIRDGMLYSLMGAGTRDEALAVANSLN